MVTPSVEDPSTWRLTTNGTNQVPYKMLDVSGNFGIEQGNTKQSVLIPADRVIDFMVDILPPAVTLGNLAYPQSSTLPGLPALAAKNVSFKRLSTTLPVDPFGFDSGAPEGTYQSVVVCEIDYGTQKVNNSDPNDPFTFLEISCDAAGEFLYAVVPKAKWVDRENPSVNEQNRNLVSDVWTDTNTGELKGVFQDPDTGELRRGNVEESEEEVNRHAQVPVTTFVPQTEWTIRWNQIPFDLYRNVIVHRVRAALGKVNSHIFAPLFNAELQTLLFAGYRYRQMFTWRDGLTDTPPASLEMKFIEKRVVWGGVVYGHNDFWRPEVGWSKLLFDGTNLMYDAWDYNQLFWI